ARGRRRARHPGPRAAPPPARGARVRPGPAARGLARRDPARWTSCHPGAVVARAARGHRDGGAARRRPRPPPHPTRGTRGRRAVLRAPRPGPHRRRRRGVSQGRRVAIVGPGRVGTLLAVSLARAGWRPVAIAGGRAEARDQVAALVTGCRPLRTPAEAV